MELRHLRIGNDDAVAAISAQAERLAVEHLASAVCLEHRYDGEDDPGRFGYDDVVTRPGYQRVLREEILSPAHSCNVSLPLRAFNVSSVGLSSHQLSELLNRVIGTSFSSYVNGYRVRAAEELLRTHTKLPILDVAFEAGFNSKTSFNVIFRRETGMSPTEYRSMYGAS